MIRRLLIAQTRQAVSILSPSRATSTSSFCVERLLTPGRRDPFAVRRSMASTISRDLFYDDIVKLSSKNEIILIDVREPAEIQETGKLPGSTHIPLGEVPNALSMDATAFKGKYGIEKPSEDAPIVFSCRSGKRSYMALEKALALGFSNVRHYAGGWLDWEKNAKQ